LGRRKVATTGYVFEDERVEGTPYVLFIDKLENEYGEEETLEVRFQDLWEAASALVKIGDLTTTLVREESKK
jgi:hypothetical protein